MAFDLTTFDVRKFDSLIARGLCSGVGEPDGQMCIEAAICNVLGMPHDDDPKCVAAAVRSYKIRTLADIPREQISKIVWIGLSGNIFPLTSEAQIDYWLRTFGTVPLQMLDGNWCSVESCVPYRCFEVFVK